MSTSQQMLASHPSPSGIDAAVLQECIEACFDCAQVCTACADACLAEESVAELRSCIRTDLDCADVCTTTGRVLSRQTEGDTAILRTLLAACAEACRVCGDECAGHADHMEHCRICAEACRRCEQACRALLDSLGTA